MSYVWPKEKKLPIRRSRKPQSDSNISGVVLIKDSGVRTSYIQFDESLEGILGSKMPYGIGPNDKAFIKIIKKTRHYDICISYIDETRVVRLWKSDKLPEWV